MEDRSFYVYAHYRLDTMEPFYIGKGKDGRKDILSRNPIHDNISKKYGHAVVVLFDNLTEEESFYYEREIIEYLVFNEGYEIPCKNCGEFTKNFSYLTNFSFGGEGVTGYNFNEETKKKMSESHKKRYKDSKERKKTSLAIKKHHEDKKAREKMSESQKKRFKDEKERKKNSHPGELNPKIKSVYCRELNIIFSYIELAKKYCINILNSKIGTIGYACDGKIKTSGRLADGTKLTWKYVEDVNQEILDNAEYIDSKRYEEIIQVKLNENK